MSDEKEKKQENHKETKNEQKASLVGKVAVIGFAGGVFWGLLAYLAYILNLTEISPNLILQPFILGQWKNGTMGNIIGIIVLGILSIGAAFVYYVLLKRFKSMYIGILFGLLLFGLVFFVLNPIFPNLKSVAELQRSTIVTTVCIYILYGLFVGYSISFEYNELNIER
ncbi:YqhR family membrane protein [Metabacillus fastidiosus]|uniref:YqhR family membrane protein n=1 Tax=Metabacillus fastidiosus TaxID=1458 RepID=UPI0008251D13|nr:YqhR family membrane protein [Metabacillus fastidiosus]MED4453529.1 YqhR family membrane protein [Metabacillus fastidiosus]MED4463821.1 YqhR family membrane protein [Metabacillus fastidiosus]